MKPTAVIMSACLLACGSKNNLVDSMPNQYQIPYVPITPNYIPCTEHKVRKMHDGMSLTDPNIHLIFWGSWNLQQYNSLVREWGTILDNEIFWAIPQEYGIKSGSVSEITNANSNLSVHSVSGVYIRQELMSEINNKILIKPDENSVYVILLPSTTQAEINVQNNYFGYHSYATFMEPGVPYSVIGYSDLNTINRTISHEIFESITDPDTVTGYRDGASEIGDLCNAVSYKFEGVNINKIWSQAECVCIPK